MIRPRNHGYSTNISYTPSHGSAYGRGEEGEMKWKEIYIDLVIHLSTIRIYLIYRLFVAYSLEARKTHELRGVRYSARFDIVTPDGPQEHELCFMSESEYIQLTNLITTYA